jgi:hypothetical protein
MMTHENSHCVRVLRASSIPNVGSNREETRNVARYGPYLKLRVRIQPGLDIAASTEQMGASPPGVGSRMRKVGHHPGLGGTASCPAARARRAHAT